MKYLCLICAEKVMEQMTEAAAEHHFQEYAEFTHDIRTSGHSKRLAFPVNSLFGSQRGGTG